MPEPADRPPNYLRAWRKHRGLTQEQLANKLGTDKAVVSLFENGKRGLDDRWLHRLAEILETSRGNILDHPPTDGAAEILNIWGHANFNERRQIISVAEALTKFKAE